MSVIQQPTAHGSQARTWALPIATANNTNSFINAIARYPILEVSRSIDTSSQLLSNPVPGSSIAPTAERSCYRIAPLTGYLQRHSDA